VAREKSLQPLAFVPFWPRFMWLHIAVPVLGIVGFIVFLNLKQGQLALGSLRLFLIFEMYVMTAHFIIVPLLKKRFQAKSKAAE
jgi:hypothetical protein